MAFLEAHQRRWIEKNFADYDVPFVVIGGVAVKFFCPDRLTSDVDLFIGADPATIDRIVRDIPQLARDPKAAAGLRSWKVGHFEVEEPYRIDVLTFAPGLDFAEAHLTAVPYEEEEVSLPILDRGLLLAHKRAVIRKGEGEEKDRLDVELLESLIKTGD